MSLQKAHVGSVMHEQIPGAVCVRVIAGQFEIELAGGIRRAATPNEINAAERAVNDAESNSAVLRERIAEIARGPLNNAGLLDAVRDIARFLTNGAS